MDKSGKSEQNQPNAPFCWKVEKVQVLKLPSVSTILFHIALALATTLSSVKSLHRTYRTYGDRERKSVRARLPQAQHIKTEWKLLKNIGWIDASYLNRAKLTCVNVAMVKNWIQSVSSLMSKTLKLALINTTGVRLRSPKTMRLILLKTIFTKFLKSRS